MTDQPLPRREELSAATLLRLLAESGYDPAKVHPDCYAQFSYVTFSKKLLDAARPEGLRAPAGRAPASD